MQRDKHPRDTSSVCSTSAPSVASANPQRIFSHTGNLVRTKGMQPTKARERTAPIAASMDPVLAIVFL